MIRLTRLNQVSLVLNSDLIEHIEMTPDTVISLTNGQKFMVRETSDQVIQRVANYRRSLLSGPFNYTHLDPGAVEANMSVRLVSDAD